MMPAIHVAEPHALLASFVADAVRARGLETVTSLHEIDSKDFLHDEAALLDDTELADAQAALVEDGLLIPGADLRSATKYAWAIAHAAQHAAESPAVWSVSGGMVATTPDELRYIVAEWKRRGFSFAALSPCWPVAIEPAIDFGENADAFLSALDSYAAVLRGSGVSLFIPNAAGKFSVLPAIVERLGSHALLDFSAIGWLEASRLIARLDAALFRGVLTCAQEHFAFDKQCGALSTTEDDVRALPDVPDSELERVFLDDARGRQLLHVTVRSVAAELTAPLDAFLRREAPQLAAPIAAELDRHLAA